MGRQQPIVEGMSAQEWGKGLGHTLGGPGAVARCPMPSIASTAPWEALRRPSRALWQALHPHSALIPVLTPRMAGKGRTVPFLGELEASWEAGP